MQYPHIGTYTEVTALLLWSNATVTMEYLYQLLVLQRSYSYVGTSAVTVLGIVIYLHTEGALYAQKSVSSWFLAVFDSKIDVCWNLKKSCQFFDTLSFSLLQSNIMKQKHFFVKCPTMWKNWALYTQNTNTRSQFWVEILC